MNFQAGKDSGTVARRAVILKTVHIRILASTLPAYVFLFCLPAFAEKSTQWVMEQRHHQSGYSKFHFTANAIKIYSKNFGFYLVSKAPDWNVHAFRPDDKTAITMTRKQFFDQQHFGIHKPPINAGAPIATDTIFSMKAKEYRSIYHDDWVAQFNGIPRPVWDLISAHYRSQRVDGIILKSVKNDKSKPKKSVLKSIWDDEPESGARLETLSLKEIPFKKSDFEVPQGYRKVTDLRQVLTSNESRREADSIIMQMGLGEKLGNEKGK